AIQQTIEASKISTADKSTFMARLEKDANASAQMEALPRTFKTIIPINDIHRDILAVRGQVLAAQGLKPLTVWKQHRYAWLPLLAEPNQREKTELNFSM